MNKMDTLESIAIQFLNRYGHNIEENGRKQVIKVIRQTTSGDIVELEREGPNRKTLKDIFLVPERLYFDDEIGGRMDKQLCLDLNLIFSLKDEIGRKHKDGVLRRFHRPCIHVTSYDERKNRIDASVSEIGFLSEHKTISDYLKENVDYDSISREKIVEAFIEYLTALTSVKNLKFDEDRGRIGKILRCNFFMIKKVGKILVDNAQSNGLSMGSELVPADITRLIYTLEPPFDKGQIVKSNLLSLLYHQDFRNYFMFQELPNTLDLKYCVFDVSVKDRDFVD